MVSSPGLQFRNRGLGLLGGTLRRLFSGRVAFLVASLGVVSDPVGVIAAATGLEKNTVQAIIDYRESSHWGKPVPQGLSTVTLADGSIIWSGMPSNIYYTSPTGLIDRIVPAYVYDIIPSGEPGHYFLTYIYKDPITRIKTIIGNARPAKGIRDPDAWNSGVVGHPLPDVE